MACICLRFFFGIKGRKLDLYLDILDPQRSLFIRKHGETYGKAWDHPWCCQHVKKGGVANQLYPHRKIACQFACQFV